MNLIILFENDKLKDDRYCLSGERAWHIRKILGCDAGDTVEVGLLNGPIGQGVIETIDKKHVTLKFSLNESENDSDLIVDLICALPRPQTLKKVLQSAATMGVRRLHLINSQRVEKCYFNASIMEDENIREHLIAGLSQGRRTMLPEVIVHRRFFRFFNEELKKSEAAEEFEGRRLLPDLDADNYLAAMNGCGVKRILLAIGPEGGWIRKEVKFMADKGFELFRLGAWPLRVENAVVASLGQIELAMQSSHSARQLDTTEI